MNDTEKGGNARIGSVRFADTPVHIELDLFAELLLVIPPLKYAGNCLEYTKKLLGGEDGGVAAWRSHTEKDDQSPRTSPGVTQGRLKPVIVKHRKSLLLGELLDVALIFLPANGAKATEAFFKKYCGLSTNADVLWKQSTTRNVVLSAISNQLWESQAFPIDAPDQATVSCFPLPECSAVVYLYEIPLTINPIHLDRPLTLQVSFSFPKHDDELQSPPGSPNSRGVNSNSPLKLAKGIRGVQFAESATVEQTLPLSAMLYTGGNNGAEMLHTTLRAPTPQFCLGVPYSSAFTGGRKSNVSEIFASTLPSAVDYRNDDESWQEPDRRDGSRNVEVLDLAIMQPALSYWKRHANGSLEESMEDVIHASCVVEVKKPLLLTTNFLDGFMYMQISNVTRETNVTIENIHIRNVNSLTTGYLPVELMPGEQYSLLLCHDEDTLQSASTQRSWDTGRGKQSRGKPAVQSSKKVLPLCAKWRPTLGNGPSVWSQFGADWQPPLRMPMEISMSCLPCVSPGCILTATLTVTNYELHDVDLTVFLPKDLLYEKDLIHDRPSKAPSTRRNSAHVTPSPIKGSCRETPPLIPVLAKKALGLVPSGGSQSVHMQFITTRFGLHNFPLLMLIDSNTSQRYLAGGCKVVVN
eukprot:Lankesteria_metandrocarpae@DN5381_c0_g1_i3.p1